MKFGIYRHYKGKLYQVLGIALLEENQEELVIYQALYAPYTLWARPKKVFLESIDFNGATLPRFAFVGHSTVTINL